MRFGGKTPAISPATLSNRVMFADLGLPKSEGAWPHMTSCLVWHAEASQLEVQPAAIFGERRQQMSESVGHNLDRLSWVVCNR